MLIDKTPVAWFRRRSDAAPYGISSIRSIAAQRFAGGKLENGRFRGGLMCPGGAVRAVLIALVLTACTRPADEEALRGRIAAMEVAIEARDAEALLDSVDVEFGGPAGMDRDGLRRYAALMLLRQQQVGVSLGPVEVELHGERTSVRFDALVTGANRLIPEGVEARRVETVWRLEDGEWMLVSADWSKPALGG